MGWRTMPLRTSGSIPYWKITLLHAQGRGYAVPTVVRFAFHTGKITGRGGDTGMAQESANILNTGPVIPAKFGRRMAQIVGFEAA